MLPGCQGDRQKSWGGGYPLHSTHTTTPTPYKGQHPLTPSFAFLPLPLIYDSPPCHIPAFDFYGSQINITYDSATPNVTGEGRGAAVARKGCLHAWLEVVHGPDAHHSHLEEEGGKDDEEDNTGLANCSDEAQAFTGDRRGGGRACSSRST